MQVPSGCVSAGHAIAPAPTAPAQAAFTHHQGQHDHQRDQGQADGACGIAVGLPGFQDARGETRDAEQLHGTQLIDHFHAHESDAGSDRGQCNGQGHTPEG